MKQRNLMFTIVVAVCVAAVGIGLAIAASFGMLNVASAPAAIAPTVAPAIAAPTTAAPATAVPTLAPTTAAPATAVPTLAPTTAAPATAVPTATLPATSVPTAAPATAVPAATLPATSVPTAAPATTVPTATLPATSIPTVAPATTVPTATLPATSIPTVAPATVLPESQGQYIEYTVQRGDTLFAIARLHNVTAEDILAANTIANPASLTIGQVLRIPTGTGATQIVEYTVQRGDILVVIARRFNVTVEEILAINTIRDPSNLTVGQVLRIPRRTP